jgi:hypothetical protein
LAIENERYFRELTHLIDPEILSPAVLVKRNLFLQCVGSNGNPELLCNSGFAKQDEILF